ncbi:hypothetical protein ABW20_dc0105587 [Dactylellina cionopaga]|nr:hypothetical protein ABW20_dc0105587 [Dactylellina cionopaga]
MSRRLLRFSDVEKFGINILTNQSLSELFPDAAGRDLHRHAGEIERYIFGEKELIYMGRKFWSSLPDDIAFNLMSRNSKMFSELSATEEVPQVYGDDLPIPEWNILTRLVSDVVCCISQMVEFEPKEDFVWAYSGGGSRIRWYLAGEKIHTYNWGKLVARYPSGDLMLCVFHTTLRTPFAPEENVAQEISRLVAEISQKQMKKAASDNEPIWITSIALHAPFVHFSQLQIPPSLLNANQILPKAPTNSLIFKTSRNSTYETLQKEISYTNSS